jgi:hypothetical protein
MYSFICCLLIPKQGERVKHGKLFFLIINFLLGISLGNLIAQTPPSSRPDVKSGADSARSMHSDDDNESSDSDMRTTFVQSSFEPSTSTSSSSSSSSSPSPSYSSTPVSHEYNSSGTKSGFESEEDSADDESPRKSDKESQELIMLKDLDGVKYMYDAKTNRWVQAYSGLMDGEWKVLEGGKVLSKKEAKKAKYEQRRQGVRSPFTEFQVFEGKNFGLDRAHKVWIEVDHYSFPVESGKRIPYDSSTLAK